MKAGRFMPKAEPVTGGAGPQARAANDAGDRAVPAAVDRRTASPAAPDVPGEGTPAAETAMPADRTGEAVRPPDADSVAVAFGGQEDVDRTADLSALEWAGGGEPLPAPANDLDGEPEWLFEGYGPTAGSTADPSGASSSGKRTAETAGGADGWVDAAEDGAGDETLDWQ